MSIEKEDEKNVMKDILKNFKDRNINKTKIEIEQLKLEIEKAKLEKELEKIKNGK